MNREYKRLWNKINSVNNCHNYQAASDTSQAFVVKITGSTFNPTDKVYDYSWQALTRSGTNNAAGGSGTSARCIQERGVDMTSRPATVQNNTIVYMSQELEQFQFSASGGSTEGSTSPDNPLGNSWARGGSDPADTQAYHYDVISDIVVDYNQNQCYAVVVTKHVDSSGSLFSETKSTKILFNLIAINN